MDDAETFKQLREKFEAERIHVQEELVRLNERLIELSSLLGAPAPGSKIRYQPRVSPNTRDLYVKQVTAYVRKHPGANRADLVRDLELPLDKQQMSNLLTSMSRNARIVNKGTRRDGEWYLPD